MPEPLKNLYSIDLVESLCGQVKGQYCGFDADGFVQHVMDNEWENKELKERMKHISESLHQYLPMQYSEAVWISIINRVLAFRCLLIAFLLFMTNRVVP